MGNRKDKYSFLRGRPTGNRSPRPTVGILCDDTKTAVAYFQEIRRSIKDKTVKIIPCRRKGATPSQLADQANEEIQKLEDANDRIWILIDRESEGYKQQEADQAQRQYGQTRKIRVALSNPCYEVWTLAHLADTGQAFLDCSAVVKEIKPLWKKEFGHEFYNKATADYSKLVQYKEDAIDRSEKHCRKPDPSWTQIHLVLKDLMSIIP